ncbi:MAG: hypothetical protein WDO68_31265 [Gammaproteobacteria bacterium]
MKTKKSRAGWIATLLLVPLSGVTFSAEKPYDLRQQIAKVEAEYFALYNKLNTDRQYDMLCKMDRATGTTLAKRVCQPRYVETAQRANASERVQTATHAGPGVDATNPSAAASSSRDDAFRKNMLEVLRQSPELQALGEKRDALQARLDELMKK